MSARKIAANLLDCSVLLILSTTAVVKLVSITQSAAYLNEYDPLFPFLTNRNMMTIAAIAELALAGLLLSSRSEQLKGLFLSWLASSFVLYHCALFLMNRRVPCKCLGGALDWLGPIASERFLNYLPLGLALYMLAVGLAKIVSRPLEPERSKHSLPSLSCN
jgi:hypothetical protein